MKEFVRKYLKPFWFADDSEIIKVPYVYGMAVIVMLIWTVVEFLLLAKAKYDASILGAVAAVIATLAGLYFGIINLYNNGKGKVITKEADPQVGEPKGDI